VEEGESPQEALVREFQEELGLDIQVGDFLCQGKFIHKQTAYELLAYRVILPRTQEPRLLEHQRVDWWEWQELENLDLAESDRALLPALWQHYLA